MTAGAVPCDWRVVGAAVRGESHCRTGQPCQDTFRWQLTGDGILIVAVADGAGSAAQGEIGAHQAASAAVASTVDELQVAVPRTEDEWRQLLLRVYRSARRSLEDKAAALDLALGDLATTLLLALATPDALAVGQVGDGAVVARPAAGGYRVVTRSEEQEFLNETTFLTSPAFLDAGRFVVETDPITGLIVFTDGLQLLALQMPQGIPCPGFFAPLLRLLDAGPQFGRAEARLSGFLQSPRVTERADDDLTLVLAVRDRDAAHEPG